MVPFGRAVAAKRHRRVILGCSAQTGKTETFLDILGQRFDQHPGPTLYIGPSKQYLTEQAEPRIMDLLDQAPSIADKVARGKRMTKTRKVIAGVPLRLAHAGSSTALKSDPFSLALTDEADELMANVKGQGNPLALIDRRGDTYADFVHAIVSTPSEGRPETEIDPATGLEFWTTADLAEVSSTIWKLFLQGTRHHWCWQCPHCREYFVPRFKCLQIEKDWTAAEARAKAWVACPRCGCEIVEADKQAMNRNGRYVAPGQTISADGTVAGEPAPNTTISFWLSGLASPFRSFGDRAAEFVEARESGDQSQVQAVINGSFGEVYLPGAGDLPEWQELGRLRRPYDPRTLPIGIVVLVAAVDVQADRLVYVVRGWGARGRSWLVEHGEILGDTADTEVWYQLSEFLADPIDGLPIKVMFIDSGFRPGKKFNVPEHRVYEFCRRHRRVAFPTKGRKTQRVPLVKSKIEVKQDGKAAKYGLDLFLLDTDHWKSFVHERIRYSVDAPGAWLLHAKTTDDYLRQLVSEVRVTSGTSFEWVERSRQNHYLDCEAMAAAAGFLLGVQRLREMAVLDANSTSKPQKTRQDGRKTQTNAAATPPAEAAEAPASPPPREASAGAASAKPAATKSYDRFAKLSAGLNRRR